MYGYIRPEIGELRVNEYRRFRTVYCGLCEALRQRYGVLSRLLISYDMTFLAALTLPAETELQQKRCPVHPFRKQSCLCPCGALYDAADYTVILAYRKMQDDAADESGFRSLRGRVGEKILRRLYRRAAERQPQFDEALRGSLQRLAAVEAAGGAALDPAADCFASALAFPAGRTKDETLRRLQSEILYHIGRAVYILDAADDFASDKKHSRYNPLCVRFGGDTMTQPEKDEIRATLNLSLARAMNACVLLPEGKWKPILENIVSCGVPHTADAVFAGTWKKNRKNTEDL